MTKRQIHPERCSEIPPITGAPAASRFSARQVASIWTLAVLNLLVTVAAIRLGGAGQITLALLINLASAARVAARNLQHRPHAEKTG
ncbi:hypothetical protein ACFV99_19885 [Streptomyces sp. NPDC059944]|uniref:hypothetical protein n=1 Tax=unclassified Streptomyces TaxID=2593676 RepID=UPI0036544EF9